MPQKQTIPAEDVGPVSTCSHRYEWYGTDTSKCKKCGKIVSDEEAESFHANANCPATDLFAVAAPMMTMSGGCAGYEVVMRGTAAECKDHRAKSGHVIIRDDETQEEVAWEDRGKWECDDESIFLANAQIEATHEPPKHSD